MSNPILKELYLEIAYRPSQDFNAQNEEYLVRHCQEKYGVSKNLLTPIEYKNCVFVIGKLEEFVAGKITQSEFKFYSRKVDYFVSNPSLAILKQKIELAIETYSLVDFETEAGVDIGTFLDQDDPLTAIFEALHLGQFYRSKMLELFGIFPRALEGREARTQIASIIYTIYYDHLEGKCEIEVPIGVMRAAHYLGVPIFQVLQTFFGKYPFGGYDHFSGETDPSYVKICEFAKEVLTSEQLGMLGLSEAD